jgi:tetratricopeptide (TPR) repeat protein
MEKERKVELYNKGKAALELNKNDEAEACFQEILQEEPDDVEVLNKMGIIYIYRKDMQKSREYFERILALDPNHVAATCNLGNIELEEGDMNKAELLYRDAIRLDPQYGTAHNNLAFILKKTGRIGEAVGHMKKANKSGTISFDMSTSRFRKVNTGCTTILVLSTLALLLWYFTK